MKQSSSKLKIYLFNFINNCIYSTTLNFLEKFLLLFRFFKDKLFLLHRILTPRFLKTENKKKKFSNFLGAVSDLELI